MRRTLRLVGLVVVAAVVALALVAAASAQLVRGMEVDRDAARIYRHPHAAGNGTFRPMQKDPNYKPGRVRIEDHYDQTGQNGRWKYRFFDHAVPSTQYFATPRSYKWYHDSYPGLENVPPGYYYHQQPIYSGPVYHNRYPPRRYVPRHRRWR